MVFDSLFDDWPEPDDVFHGTIGISELFENGHLRHKALLSLGKETARLDGHADDAMRSHIKSCSKCKETWNEYYEEWFS